MPIAKNWQCECANRALITLISSKYSITFVPGLSAEVQLVNKLVHAAHSVQLDWADLRDEFSELVAECSGVMARLARLVWAR